MTLLPARLRAPVTVAVAALAVGAVLGAATVGDRAVPHPTSTMGLVGLRPFVLPQTAQDRLWRPVPAVFVPSTSRLMARPPDSRLYLVRDTDGRVCLLLSASDGRTAAACRTQAAFASTPLTVRLVELRTDGVRVGVEAEADGDGATGWALA